MSLFCGRFFVLIFLYFLFLLCSKASFDLRTFTKYPSQSKHAFKTCFTLLIHRFIDQTGFDVVLAIVQVNSKSRSTYSVWTVKCNWVLSQKLKSDLSVPALLVLPGDWCYCLHWLKPPNLMERHDTGDQFKVFFKDLKWGGNPLFLRGAPPLSVNSLY